MYSVLDLRKQHVAVPRQFISGKFGRIKSFSGPPLNVYAFSYTSTAGCSNTDHLNHQITDCVTVHANKDDCVNFLARCHPE